MVSSLKYSSLLMTKVDKPVLGYIPGGCHMVCEQKMMLSTGKQTTTHNPLKKLYISEL